MPEKKDPMDNPWVIEARTKIIVLAAEELQLSLAEIEAILKTPLSRSRIHQILTASTAKKIKK